MLVLMLENHEFSYELTDIIKMFFGKIEIKAVSAEALAGGQSFLRSGTVVKSRVSENNGKTAVTAEIMVDGKPGDSITEAGDQELTGKELKKLLKLSMYKLLSKHTGKAYPWGVLTGIRPVKLVHELMDKGLDEKGIEERLEGEYLIRPERAELALKVAKVERSYVYPVKADKVSLYAGIPFCPSRCYYCSFTSNPIGKYAGSLDAYLDAMEKEMKAISEFLEKRKYKVQTIYLGGGTPTSLDEERLLRLLGNVNSYFGGSRIEFTCEAGRPDSLTGGKLKALKNAHVTRISINPQSMNAETLRLIGRAHSPEQVEASFRMARDLGFDNINMDLILGLPGEDLESLKKTLERLGKLDPESVTVHTLAIKRASLYNEGQGSEILAGDGEVSDMMDYAMDFLASMKMRPYYLYRQKHMLQNLENIGFCKPGFECIYNMQIIEEKQTNIGIGADAVTKAVFHRENRIERQHNIKDVALYINNIEQQIQKKLELLGELTKND